jgi:hypothetical protein
VKNLPNWGNWSFEELYLPSEFHSASSIIKIRNLAREPWLEMGSDAELVVLSMGLALRDISAVQFLEEDETDCPDWIRSSPLRITDGEELMDLWKKQLPAEEKVSAEVSDPKGKGKAKAAQRKRKIVPSTESMSSEEEKPE